MKTMTLDEIQRSTLSKGIGTRNCVYRAINKTVFSYDIDGDSETPEKLLQDIEEGDLIAISGCGSQLAHRKESFYMFGDKWGTIPNRDMEHYANEILEERKLLS